MMLSSRQISKGFVQTIFVEMKKNKKINWASQGEWTSAKQFRRHVTVKQSGQFVDESFDSDGEQINTNCLEEGVCAIANYIEAS